MTAASLRYRGVCEESLNEVVNGSYIYTEFVNQMLCSLYVDDLSVSLVDVNKAYQLYLESRESMAQEGFNLRKWLTNSRHP